MDILVYVSYLKSRLENAKKKKCLGEGLFLEAKIYD